MADQPTGTTPEVLFSITPDHLDTGLRGFPIGTCRTSTVNPIKGVAYVGYPIDELAPREPEEVVFLLMNRRMPEGDELQRFSDELKRRRGIPQDVLDVLGQLPRDGHPMAWLSVGLLLLGMKTRTENWMEDSLNLIARSTELVAAIYRLRSGWGPLIKPSPDKDLIEDFVHMLDVPGADAGKLTQLLKSFYVLHMDHGGGNLSTFIGKGVASGLADVYTSMAAAMDALSGPLHGGANEECLNQVMEIGTADPDAVEKYVRDQLSSGGKVFGFGHAVLRAEDPRARVQYELGEELCPNDPYFRTAVTLRQVAVKVLKENPKIQNPYPNVDAVSGSLLQALGLKDTSYYTVLFGLSRIAGIAAQIVDERTGLRGGKGVPIYRPKYVAKDQPERHINKG